MTTGKVAVRLQAGDPVEIQYNQDEWLTGTFHAYDRNCDFKWLFDCQNKLVSLAEISVF